MRLLLLAILMGASLARAGLDWEQQEVTLKVHATQVSANAVFRFTNTGTEPIELGDIRVTCGCLFPVQSKKSYAPGESGELTIEFNLLNRTGDQRKAVLVMTDPHAPTKLFINAAIPDAFIIEPRLVRWGKDSIEKVKTVRLVNPNTYPIKLLSAQSSNPQLPIHLLTIREGYEYEIPVNREKAASNSRSVIRIETEPPPGETKAKQLKLYVHVQ